jgi:hypothetical protein
VPKLTGTAITGTARMPERGESECVFRFLYIVVQLEGWLHDDSCKVEILAVVAYEQTPNLYLESLKIRESFWLIPPPI